MGRASTSSISRSNRHASARGSAAVDLGPLGGISLAVTMVSVASALFVRLFGGTVRA
jgi:hypothetical protein